MAKTVTKVEFYEGTTKIGEALTSPYTIQWSGATVGNKSITAKAIFDDGSTQDSVPVNITINEVSTIPSYTAEPETSAFTTAVAVPDDNTVLFAGTPQELTGEAYTYHIDKLIKDLKVATGASDLSTVFSAIYPRFGNSYDMCKYNLLNPQDTDAAFRLTYSSPNYIFAPEGVKMDTIAAGNPREGYYWSTFIDSSTWDGLGHGVISVIGSNDVNNPAGRVNYFFSVTANKTSDPEASTIAMAVGDNKEMTFNLNGTQDKGTVTGEDIRGVYASVKVGTTNAGTESGVWKNGLKRVTLSGGPYGDNPPNGPVFGGALIGPDGTDVIDYSNSKQLHLSEAYIKAPLTEAQIVAVSNAFSDFEGRINRKTW